MLNPKDQRLKVQPKAQIGKDLFNKEKDSKKSQMVQKTGVNGWEVRKVEKERACMFF